MAIAGAILLIAILGITQTFAATTSPVNLSTASNFVILAGSSVINFGSSNITGNIGVHPGGILSGLGSATIYGTQQTSNAATAQAQTDLGIAYNDVSGRINQDTISGDLGGTTIYPGLYRSASSISLNGVLTLDAQGDANAIFVIQSADNLNIASGARIALLGGAQACNIYWQSGNGVFLGTNSIMVGNVVAYNAISLGNGALLNGRLLSRNGSVTLDTNTITTPTCGPQSPLGNLHIITNVVNNSGGSSAPAGFTVRVRGSGNNEVPGSPTNGMVSPGTNYTLTGGITYTLSVDAANSTYLPAQFSGDCSVTGAVFLPLGGNLTCTITIDDAPQVDYCPSGDFSPNTHDGHCVIPVIDVAVKAIPDSVPYAGSSLTYLYTVGNPGRIALSNVSISDNGCSDINPVSGDNNQNGLLDTNEYWIYSCTTFVSASVITTTRVSGNGDGLTATSSMPLTVMVRPYENPGTVVVTPTFPNTGFNPRNSFLVNTALRLYDVVTR